MLILTVIFLSISNLTSTAAMIRSRASFQLRSVRKCFHVTMPSMALSTSSQSSDIVSEVVVPGRAAVKRKVGMTLAYVGSNYHGLQMDLKSGVPTIEAVVEDALFKMGCITASNHLDLSKISWSRSSRTDKHVHCAKLVISAKLEIPVEWMSETEQRIFPMVKQLNSLLPPDIRCISVCRVNQSFRAREACSWREYEYVLPKALLLDSNNLSGTAEEKSAIALFAAALKKLEGNQGFHNFHRVSPKNLKRRIFSDEEDDFNDRNKGQDVTQASQQIGGDEAEGEEVEAVDDNDSSSAIAPGEAEVEVEVGLGDSSSDSAVAQSPRDKTDTGYVQTWNYFDNWEPVLRERNGEINDTYDVMFDSHDHEKTSKSDDGITF